MRTTVQDVMTTDVATVNQNASFHQVAELLISRGDQRRAGTGRRTTT